MQLRLPCGLSNPVMRYVDGFCYMINNSYLTFTEMHNVCEESSECKVPAVTRWAALLKYAMDFVTIFSSGLSFAQE